MWKKFPLAQHTYFLLEKVESLPLGPLWPRSLQIRFLRLSEFPSHWRTTDNVRAIILGQDPYPTPGMAEGFSFSVAKENSILPPSLKNIFREYSEDLGLPLPRTGHLGRWSQSGVLLLNRILTVQPRAPLSHQGIGWEVITDRILNRLAESKVPIICWGGQAEKAAVKNGFAPNSIFAAPHPSPLSAYRGFFGSKPFSSVNKYLMQSNAEIIDWNLESD
ncbi:MAG: uracil-DNA glycosylase [Actinobacteria bacterium]|nr:uracil-DNA glycosylase [Actinomycetota bacterium]